MRTASASWLWIGIHGFALGVAVFWWDFLHLFLHQDSGGSLVSAAWANLSLSRLALAGLTGSVVLSLSAAVGASLLYLRGAEIDGDFRALDALRLVARLVWILAPFFTLTLLTTGSLLMSPVAPYGADLPVSLLLEGPFLLLLSCLLALSGLVSLHRSLGASDSSSPPQEPVPPAKSGSPRLVGVGILLAATALFWIATPARFVEDGAGQGNMFKYIRMAAAVSHTGGFDIRGAEGAASQASVSTLVSSMPALAGRFFSESRNLIGQFAREASAGRLYRGRISAGRANRSMFRTEDGAVYYINAPGPGLMLVPAYLVDRYLNRAFDTTRQVAVILFWNLLGALLVYEIFLSCRGLVGAKSALLTAFGLAVSTPFLFYTFQIYPELPGGLLLLFAFRKLLMARQSSLGAVLAAAAALAYLPWLHQKYSVVAAVIAILAGWPMLRGLFGTTDRKAFIVRLLALAVPLAFSAYTIFLFNHALTGGLQPTATFEAAGRSSFEPQNSLRGLLGLLLDRDNGVFIFAPIYVLAVPGMLLLYRSHRRLCLQLVLVLASYLIVIASFPYWPGAVSTMARYILSALPLMAIPLSMVIDRAFRDGALAGVALVLWSASIGYTLSFSKDLVPSYHAQLLWHRAWFADPNRYIPDFLTPGPVGSGPAHIAKLIVLLLLVVALTAWVYRRCRRGRPEVRGFVRAAGLGAAAIVFGLSLLSATVERAPQNGTEKNYPTYASSRAIGPDRQITAFGNYWLEQNGYWIAGASAGQFWLLSSDPGASFRVVLRSGAIENTVRFFERGRPPRIIELPPNETVRREIRVSEGMRFEGPQGVRYLHRFWIQAEESFVPAEVGTGSDSRRLGAFVRFR